jgi:Transposase DDE domain
VRVLEAVQDPDLEWLLLDSTVIRAHPHAAGMNTAGSDQALGYSRGGFGTKLHLSVDALGNPVTLHLSPGQDADVTHADVLLGDQEFGAVLADKGYDSDALAATIAARWGGGGDPATKQSYGAARVRSGAVQGTEQGRAVREPVEAVPTGGHPVRKDGSELPRDGHPGRHHHLVEVVRMGNWETPPNPVSINTA